MLPLPFATLGVAPAPIDLVFGGVLAAIVASGSTSRHVVRRVVRRMVRRTVMSRHFPGRRVVAFAIAPAALAFSVAIAEPALPRVTSARSTSPAAATVDTHPAAARIPLAAGPRPVRVLVVGDSTAAYLGGALRNVAQTGRRMVFANMGVPGCQLANAYAQSMVVRPAIWAVQPDTCHHWAERLAPARMLNPDIVLVVFGPTEMADLQLVRNGAATNITRAAVQARTRSEAAAIRAEFPHARFVWATSPRTFAGSATIPARYWSINDETRTATWNRIVGQLAAQEHGTVLDQAAFVAAAPRGLTDRNWRPDGTHMKGAALARLASWTISRLWRVAPPINHP